MLMARRAYADASIPAAEQGARRILNLVRGEGIATVRVSDLQRRKLTGLRDAAAIKAALGVLAEADVVREEKAPTPGRTASVWHVNPKLRPAS
ncbi:MAG: putative DNA primase/helicase [Paracoccaceae bacterium]|jgi:putative DNA primase/helicase